MFSSSSFSYLGHLPFTAVSGAFRLHLSAPDCWVGDTGLKMQSTFLFLSWQTRLTDIFHKCSPSQCLHLDRKWQEEMGSMKHKEVNYLHLLQSNIKAEKNSEQIHAALLEKLIPWPIPHCPSSSSVLSSYQRQSRNFPLLVTSFMCITHPSVQLLSAIAWIFILFFHFFFSGVCLFMIFATYILEEKESQ